jgi:hypothetical protein
LIFANIIVIAFEYHDIEPSSLIILEQLNAIFSLLYIVESIIKILVLGLKNYIQNYWNILDLTVSIIGGIDLLISLVF